MDQQLLDKRLTEIQEKQIRFEAERKQCMDAQDYERAEEIGKELERIVEGGLNAFFSNRGAIRYPEDEMVEYEPGKFMPANEYYMLIDDD